jgi:hypothetical protein
VIDATPEATAPVRALLDRTPAGHEPTIAVLDADAARDLLPPASLALAERVLALGGGAPEPVPPAGLVTVPAPVVLRDGRRAVSPALHFAPPVYDAFRALAAAAEADGVGSPIAVSAYRSPLYQALLFIDALAAAGGDVAATERRVLPPADSEHCRAGGHAVDLGTVETNADPHALADTPLYRWLRRRAGELGFVESYPPGVGGRVAAEPWHWRFAG